MSDLTTNDKTPWGMTGRGEAPPAIGAEAVVKRGKEIVVDAVTFGLVTQLSAEQQLATSTVEASYDSGIVDASIEVYEENPDLVGADPKDLKRQASEIDALDGLEKSYRDQADNVANTTLLRRKYLLDTIKREIQALLNRAAQERATGSTDTRGRAATLLLEEKIAKSKKGTQQTRVTNRKHKDAVALMQKELDDAKKTIAQLQQQLGIHQVPTPETNPPTPTPPHNKRHAKR